jgi:hypothetical protein
MSACGTKRTRQHVCALSAFGGKADSASDCRGQSCGASRIFHAAGASDLVLRNVNTGAFQVYNIANNQLTGAAPLSAVGLDWQLGDFAADPPSSEGSTSQPRAGDGRFRRRSRHLEYRPPRGRRITAAVSNDAARLKRSFLKAADRVSAPTRRGLEPQAGLSCNCPWPTVLSASCCNNIVEHLEAAIRHICVRY